VVALIALLMAWRAVGMVTLATAQTLAQATEDDPDAAARADYEHVSEVGPKEAWDAFLKKYNTGLRSRTHSTRPAYRWPRGGTAGRGSGRAGSCRELRVRVEGQMIFNGTAQLVNAA
jgi:hypothetical protein